MTKKIRGTEANELTKPVERQHIWMPGHHPDDPDAHPESGYEYIKLSPEIAPDTRDLRNKYKAGGGPESGYPCMHCGDMTRIVEEVSALVLLSQPALVDGEWKSVQFTDEQKEKFRDKMIAVLMCPKCEAITQMRADVVRTLRTRWLEKEGK
jgi:hypothetical protein